jgi:hypothetical protein
MALMAKSRHMVKAATERLRECTLSVVKSEREGRDSLLRQSSRREALEEWWWWCWRCMAAGLSS